jgi:thiamine-monophosphate kinase
MKVTEPGEFGLIDIIAGIISDSQGNRPASRRIISDIGDDTAAWRTEATTQLATVDSMVQGVHFTLDTITWRELGWKSLAINLSDIAAMGGTPEYALVALAIPDDTEVGGVTELYQGMLELANRHETAIIGGNICLSPVISITITVTGSGNKDRILRRSAAKPGESIAVTGYPGSAAAGLEMLTKKLMFGAETATYLRNAFTRPVPRIIEGKLLLDHGVAAAIDISDGLAADLGHICEASGVSARIETTRLPLHGALKDKFGERARELALGGGEDYELLFTGNNEIIEKIKADAACPVTIIGEITEGSPGTVNIIDDKGKQIKTDRAGWKHF